MKIKKIILYVIVAILGVLLLNLIATAQIKASECGYYLDTDGLVLWHAFGGVFAFLFGVLLEWRTVVKLLKKEIRLGFSWLHICAIVILIISLIPPSIIIIYIGIRFPFTHGAGGFSLIAGALAHSSVVQKILSVVAGSFIIKGLSQKKIYIAE